MRKGQKAPESVKKAVTKANRERLLARYNWNFIEPYLDYKISFRKITFRIFKQLIEDGNSCKDIKKMGYNKHVVGFMSNFCQGKVVLSKEDFIKDYESGESLIEIAEKYNIVAGDIRFLKQLYKIKTKGATFIHRKKTEVPLTQRQREIIYGSMLGDAKRFAPASIGFGQGERQKDYLYWKYDEMKSLATKNGIKKYENFDKRSNKTHVSYRFYTHSNTELGEINKIFYREGEKDIPIEILNKLTELSLAVWFMDDGRTDWKYSKRFMCKNNRIKPECCFCTDSFSRETCECFSILLRYKWKIRSHPRYKGKRKDGKDKYRVVLCTADSYDFIDLISPYVIPSMRYKVDYKEYLKWRKEKETYKF